MLVTVNDPADTFVTTKSIVRTPLDSSWHNTIDVASTLLLVTTQALAEEAMAARPLGALMVVLPGDAVWLVYSPNVNLPLNPTLSFSTSAFCIERSLAPAVV